MNALPATTQFFLDYAPNASDVLLNEVVQRAPRDDRHTSLRVARLRREFVHFDDAIRRANDLYETTEKDLTAAASMPDTEPVPAGVADASLLTRAEAHERHRRQIGKVYLAYVGASRATHALTERAIQARLGTDDTMGQIRARQAQPGTAYHALLQIDNEEAASRLSDRDCQTGMDSMLAEVMFEAFVPELVKQLEDYAPEILVDAMDRVVNDDDDDDDAAQLSTMGVARRAMRMGGGVGSKGERTTSVFDDQRAIRDAKMPRSKRARAMLEGLYEKARRSLGSESRVGAIFLRVCNLFFNLIDNWVVLLIGPPPPMTGNTARHMNEYNEKLRAYQSRKRLVKSLTYSCISVFLEAWLSQALFTDVLPVEELSFWGTPTTTEAGPLAEFLIRWMGLGGAAANRLRQAVHAETVPFTATGVTAAVLYEVFFSVFLGGWCGIATIFPSILGVMNHAIFMQGIQRTMRQDDQPLRDVLGSAPLPLHVRGAFMASLASRFTFAITTAVLSHYLPNVIYPKPELATVVQGARSLVYELVKRPSAESLFENIREIVATPRNYYNDGGTHDGGEAVLQKLNRLYETEWANRDAQRRNKAYGIGTVLLSLGVSAGLCVGLYAATGYIPGVHALDIVAPQVLKLISHGGTYVSLATILGVITVGQHVVGGSVTLADNIVNRFAPRRGNNHHGQRAAVQLSMASMLGVAVGGVGAIISVASDFLGMLKETVLLKMKQIVYISGAVSTLSSIVHRGEPSVDDLVDTFMKLIPATEKRRLTTGRQEEIRTALRRLVNLTSPSERVDARQRGWRYVGTLIRAAGFVLVVSDMIARGGAMINTGSIDDMPMQIARSFMGEVMFNFAVVGLHEIARILSGVSDIPIEWLTMAAGTIGTAATWTSNTFHFTFEDPMHVFTFGLVSGTAVKVATDAAQVGQAVAEGVGAAADFAFASEWHLFYYGVLVFFMIEFFKLAARHF